ncbi:hypothetical protein C8R48DRAFT_727816 [Suillus tomentosus]|nr:hypothetical protein C8R48DRAFT_727816 [Suillus tomentosus]
MGMGCLACSVTTRWFRTRLRILAVSTSSSGTLIAENVKRSLYMSLFPSVLVLAAALCSRVLLRVMHSVVRIRYVPIYVELSQNLNRTEKGACSYSMQI